MNLRIRPSLTDLADRKRPERVTSALLWQSYLAQRFGESGGECGHGTNSYALAADAKIGLEGE